MRTLRVLIIAIVAFIPMLTAAQTEEPYRELTCDEMQERIDCLKREQERNPVRLDYWGYWWNDTILEYTVEYLENVDKRYRLDHNKTPSASIKECEEIYYDYMMTYNLGAANLSAFIGKIANCDTLRGLQVDRLTVYPWYIKGYLDAYKKYKKYIKPKDLNFCEIIDDARSKKLFARDDIKSVYYFRSGKMSYRKYGDSFRVMEDYFFEELRKEIAEEEAKQNSPGTPAPHEQ